ncbi:MAG: hypothetical protein JWM05_458 [Acidimicrobiales bacterium]|nr:hypothetical protein [Acidimicrobiales bacterium]
MSHQGWGVIEGRCGVAASGHTARWVTAGAAVVALALVATSCWSGSSGRSASPSARSPAASGLSKIKHVVVIMQENRSFDSYFGTYPGADGLARDANGFLACLPDPVSKRCVRPHHSSASERRGAAHTAQAAQRAIDGGKMDGFVVVDRTFCGAVQGGCPNGAHRGVESMAYHDAREIPNYWQYAKDYVLQDRMFASNVGWSLPSHLAMVSGWSARCSSTDPKSCVADNDLFSLGHPTPPSSLGPGAIFSWTDLTDLLHRHKVSWGYYVEPGTEPDCADSAAECAPVPSSPATPGIWNPLPYFTTVRQNKELGNVQAVSKFRAASLHGTLPAVSWIVPSEPDSEHPPGTIPKGQAWVTGLVNDIMRGPNWDSTAIFVSWDDWGGFYDHVVPPKVDANGYGIRVPGLLISPYARKGLIDHQTLSHDAYLKLIEDVFLGGARLDPATDGRPDPRTSVRENAKVLGDLSREFDFTQPPRSPHLLPTKPPPGPSSLLPRAPSGVDARPRDGGARVTWTASPTNNRLLITGYVVRAYAGSQVKATVSVPATATAADVAGLVNGTSYRYRVAAINGIGTGISSARTRPVVAGAPSPPGGPRVTSGHASVALSWTKPRSDNGSPITGYVVTTYRSGSPHGTAALGADAMSFTVTGLTSGDDYQFTVTARNARGLGSPSGRSRVVVAR